MLNTFNDDKVRDSGQKTNSRQKVREFCSKLSWNPNSFLELGSQDPPLFAGLLFHRTVFSIYPMFKDLINASATNTLWL